MAVRGAEVAAERMGSGVELIDPWNLLWVMPAKGTRCLPSLDLHNFPPHHDR